MSAEGVAGVVVLILWCADAFLFGYAVARGVRFV